MTTRIWGNGDENTDHFACSLGRLVQRRWRCVPLTVAALTLGASLSTVPITPVAASTAVRTVQFSGHYTGTATLLINNGAVTISSIKGTGSGTLVGPSHVSGSGSASAAAQCDPFGGGGTITGSGSKIILRVANATSQGCSSGESGPVTVTFHGVAQATGGTGKAAGAKGDLKFTGTLKLSNTSGTQNGPFSVNLTGKLNL